jgi:hypothetical protein
VCHCPAYMAPEPFFRVPIPSICVTIAFCEKLSCPVGVDPPSLTYHVFHEGAFVLIPTDPYSSALATAQAIGFGKDLAMFVPAISAQVLSVVETTIIEAVFAFACAAGGVSIMTAPVPRVTPPPIAQGWLMRCLTVNHTPKKIAFITVPMFEDHDAWAMGEPVLPFTLSNKIRSDPGMVTDHLRA